MEKVPVKPYFCLPLLFHFNLTEKKSKRKWRISRVEGLDHYLSIFISPKQFAFYTNQSFISPTTMMFVLESGMFTVIVYIRMENHGLGFYGTMFAALFCELVSFNNKKKQQFNQFPKFMFNFTCLIY